jgi:hypothetical protein
LNWAAEIKEEDNRKGEEAMLNSIRANGGWNCEHAAASELKELYEERTAQKKKDLAQIHGS